MLLAAALTDKGAWPAAGGTGDQTAFARAAIAFVWAEQAALDAEELDRINRRPTP